MEKFKEGRRRRPARKISISFQCCSEFVFISYVVFYYEIAIFPTGGVFSYLPNHVDLALEDSVGHSTCMSVLARRRAIIGWWGGWWVLGGGVCLTGVGIPLYPWQHVDRTVWAAR